MFYTENLPKDLVRIAKAIASNQLARFAPAAYVRLTGQTGRGAETESAADIGDYFLRCFDDYLAQLGIARETVGGYLEGKDVLEYGPGDVLGVALLFFAHGANSVRCVDRFPLNNVSELNVGVYRYLLDQLPAPARQRAETAFVDPVRPERGFDPARIEYRVTPNGLCGESAAFDLILSRAVLEHVNDLPRTMQDIQRSLRPSGVSIHQVDLKSHGLDRYRPLDFLSWPAWLYALMYSHKGFPNRIRANVYRELVAAAGLELRHMAATDALPAEAVEAIRGHLDSPFREVPADLLGWLGFWVIVEQTANRT